VYFVYWVVQLGVMFAVLAAVSPDLNAWEFCELLITIVVLALGSLEE
jgi:hypothetical protein